MERNTTVITPQEVEGQLEYCRKIRALNEDGGRTYLAFVDTYGCQQNEADSERLRGYLSEMGYGFTQDEGEADVIVINTCAVREHADLRALGNVGALIHTKRSHPGQLICLCGCMAQEPGMAEKIRESYRQVDLVFGPHMLWRFPELLWRLRTGRGRIFEVGDAPGSIAEGIPVVRQSGLKAWVSIMYGCNNFCSYCIVPYVRGRERSRESGEILREIRELIAAGYKEVTLLGQNVNSYGKDLGEGITFAGLLRAVNAIPGDFLIRFMTSHPKDAGDELWDAMAECEKVAPVIHLPFQAGSDRVLRAMNRGYTHEEYLAKVEALRRRLPEVVLTSDVIVGFPGETTEEFEETLELLREVEFDALFTFIYSPRPGTPAAKLPDPMSKEEKNANFLRLVELQNEISARKHAAYVGKTLRCLVDGEGEDGFLTARTPGNRLVRLRGDKSLIGGYHPVRITASATWALTGESV